MRWIRRTASVMWVASCAAKSRAKEFTDISAVHFAVALAGNRAHPGNTTNRALATSLSPAGNVSATFAEHARFAAEPCSLLLLGTGAVGVILLVLREHFRIKPEALLEAQSSSVALPEAVART